MRVTMFAPKTQDDLKCVPTHIGDPVVRTDGCTDGQSCDYYVTTKISWLDRSSNLLSNGAPLARYTHGSAISLVICVMEFLRRCLAVTEIKRELSLTGVLQHYYYFFFLPSHDTPHASIESSLLSLSARLINSNWVRVCAMTYISRVS